MNNLFPLTKNIVGLSKEEAIEKILSENGDYRFVKVDGHDCMLTDDFKYDRISLEIEGDVVTSAYIL